MQLQTPFDSFTVHVPHYAGCPHFNIVDLGAEPGDKQKNGLAIREAIDQANSAEGGVVVIPKGEWLVGAIHLKSNVCLHLDDGATLVFSGDPADYLPPVQTTWEGIECFNYSPLIYAFKCRNVAITGAGKLKALLDIWRVWYDRPEPHMQALVKLYEQGSTNVPVDQRQMVGGDANLRPQFIQFNRCENVLVEGVAIEDSPFWVIHPFLSTSITIRRITVVAHGHNCDGVDIEMSQDVLIEDCHFDQGDDVIAIKSGRNQDAWRLNTPSKNIVVRNCRVRNGHQLLAVGSELSGGVENVFIHNCVLDPQINHVMHLLFIKTNHRRGGYVKNICMKDITAGDLRNGILGIETDVLYQWRDLVPTYEERLTPITQIFLENIQVGAVQYVSKIVGDERLPIGDVVVRGVTISKSHEEPIQNQHIEQFDFQVRVRPD